MNVTKALKFLGWVWIVMGVLRMAAFYGVALQTERLSDVFEFAVSFTPDSLLALVLRFVPGIALLLWARRRDRNRRARLARAASA